MQLRFVNEADQSFVIAAHQQMVTRATLRQAFEVCPQSSQHRQAAVLAMRQHGTTDLPADRMLVWRVAVPINSTQMQF